MSQPSRPSRNVKPTEKQQHINQAKSVKANRVGRQQARKGLGSNKGSTTQASRPQSQLTAAQERQLQELQSIKKSQLRKLQEEHEHGIQAMAAPCMQCNCTQCIAPSDNEEDNASITGDATTFDDVYGNNWPSAVGDINQTQDKDFDGSSGHLDDNDDENIGSNHSGSSDDDDESGAAANLAKVDNGITVQESPKHSEVPRCGSLRQSLKRINGFSLPHTLQGSQSLQEHIQERCQSHRHSGPYKVTSNCFMLKTLHLLEHSKQVERRLVTTDHAFAQDLDEQAVAAIKEAAASADSSYSTDYQGALNHLLSNIDHLNIGITFIMFFSDLCFSMTEPGHSSRSEVPGQYGIPGRKDPADVAKDVQFLLHKGTFKYGGINLEACTFDHMQLYGHNIFPSMIQLEYFMTKGTANVLAFQDIIKHRCISPATIALSATVIEHALMEYPQGTHRKTDFTESARSRYLFHLSSYTKIAQGARCWAEQFERKLFDLILNQSNKSFLLEVDADDLPDVDMTALAAAAEEESHNTAITNTAT
uniref:DUF6532 domain-containing protein n=1 Tax=Moniliophthora roreri TaxID=221103 RepID=A0A0W0FAH2_MONRR